MSQLCVISGTVTGPQGAVAGAIVSITRCVVSNARSMTYEVATTTDANGAFSFSVPQGARVRFASPDVVELDGWNMTAPNSNTINLGNYQADFATEAGARGSGFGSIPAAIKDYVTSVAEYGDEACRKTVITFRNLPVTLVKNGTTSGGGGTAIYNFPAGLINAKGGSTDLTVANALDKSFLASIGSAAAGTDGSLTGTEISFLPQTAATTTSGAGTCKMKATSTTPTPGNHLDGTASSIVAYLNACLNADATGAEALTFSGPVTLVWGNHGDN